MRPFGLLLSATTCQPLKSALAEGPAPGPSGSTAIDSVGPGWRHRPGHILAEELLTDWGTREPAEQEDLREGAPAHRSARPAHPGLHARVKSGVSGGLGAPAGFPE